MSSGTIIPGLGKRLPTLRGLVFTFLFLLQRVSELQRIEKGLRVKVSLLEDQHQAVSVDDMSLMDTPEDVLRQRITQLEAMDKHHRQQVFHSADN